ncbi:MAG: hypothetical protein EOL86_10740, partial [Deltaproteobacteria bacterium]|nr:hypothetical protein [Deltaproteobacteria bacterium]
MLTNCAHMSGASGAGRSRVDGVHHETARGGAMEGKLDKKYGLFTAISMVVGIVIGSGVFF